LALLKAKYLPINNEDTLNAQGAKAYFYIHAVKTTVGKLINQEDEGYFLESVWVKFINRFMELSLDEKNQVLDFLHCIEETGQLKKLVDKELEEQYDQVEKEYREGLK
tara:strand:- start:562 stop:885 length:324 start_codon:yes stop_codon:yes gene_type:complete